MALFKSLSTRKYPQQQAKKRQARRVRLGVEVLENRLQPAGSVTLNTAMLFTALDGNPTYDNDGLANGILTINGDLTIQNGGAVTADDAPPIPSGSGASPPIIINVKGNVHMEAGSEITADNNISSGDAGTIAITAGGNITLDGTSGATPGALISAVKGGGTGSGSGGDITLIATGDIDVQNGAKVDVSAVVARPAGDIAMTGFNIHIAGSVLSQSPNTGNTLPGGGTITIKATEILKIDDTGVVSSSGKDPGADLVHLEGCDVTIYGLVESTGTGHAAPSNPPNHLNNHANHDPSFTYTAGVEVWAGDFLVIDSVSHHGQVNADLTSGEGNRSFIDLFARDDIQIIGQAVATGTFFSVHATNAGNGAHGGLITITSTEETITANGLAVNAGAQTAGLVNPPDGNAAGGSGGNISITALKDIILDTSKLSARGDDVPTVGVGGTIAVRSSTGNISWLSGVGDVRPTGQDLVPPDNGVPAANRGLITLQAAGSVTTTGTLFPFQPPAGNTAATSPTITPNSPPPAPTVPEYVVLADCEGHIIVDKVTIPGGDTTSFSFTTTGTGYSGFGLTDAAAPNDQTLEPGTYSVAELVPAGWDLTNLVIDDPSGDSTSNFGLGGSLATLVLAAGETIHVTYTDTKRGHIIVDKVTNPTGDPTSFSFSTTGTGYSSFGLTDAAAPNDQTLAPGTYTVAELVPAGWDLTNLVIVDPSGDSTSNFGSGGSTATLVLAAGETIQVTYTDTKRGHIIVDKVTNPSGDSTSFSFNTTGTGYAGFGLTDAAAPNDQTLAPGTYTVAELVPAGWDLTNLVIVDPSGGSSSNFGSGGSTATLALAAGETITVTYTDTKRGHIIVDKVTNPSGDPTSFSFSTTGTGYSSFGLTDAAAPNDQTLAPGTYTVAELVPAGWDLTNLVIVDPSGGSSSNFGSGGSTATLALAAGETITVTYTDTKRTHIIVDKVTNPSEDPTSFTFNTTGSGYAGFSLTDLAAPNDQTLTPGTYTVAELVPAGWKLTNLVIVDPTGDSTSNFATGGSTATLVLAAGETITVTYTDTKLGRISGYKFNDLNGDGNWQLGGDGLPNTGDAGEEPTLQGWTIFLSGPVSGSQVTDSNGFFEFDNLPAGVYDLTENPLSQLGFIPTTASPLVVTLVAGGSSANNNFGNEEVQIPQLSLPPCIDINEIFSISDPDSPDDLRFGFNQSTFRIGQISDPQSLDPPTTVPSGGNATLTLAHGILVVNSDGTYTYTPTSPTSFPHVSDTFTYTIVNTTSGVSVPGPTVTLPYINSAPVPQDDNITGTSGNVLANDSDPDGDPLVVVSVAEGNTTTPVLGPSVIVLTHGKLTISPNGTFSFVFTDNSTTQTFSYEVSDGCDPQPAEVILNRTPILSGCVYLDLNENGIEDPGERGIPGVTIKLYVLGDSGYQLLATTTTNSGGTYKFNDLTPGTYKIVEVQPAGFRDGADDLGFVAGVHDGVVGNDVFSNIVLVNADQGVDYCFGEKVSKTMFIGSIATPKAPPPPPPVVIPPPEFLNNTVNKPLVVKNAIVPPANGNPATLTAAVSGPALGVRGQPLNFTLTGAETGAAAGASFTFRIDWDGNGTVDQTVSGPSGTTVTHAFPANGNFMVSMAVVDGGGHVSAQKATQPVTIKALASQTDPSDSSKTALVVGGTTGSDKIIITPTTADGQTVSVSINGVVQGGAPFTPTGHIFVYAQAGNDTIQELTKSINGQTVSIAIPALLFGGAGNNVISAAGSKANNILVGGSGKDALTGGSGRDILIGGAGADSLRGGGGDDILIGGSTICDANLQALLALASEWGRTDRGYTARIQDLFGVGSGGLNSAYFLNSQAIQTDSAVNQLYGQGGSDWFWISSVDKVQDQGLGEIGMF